jgi:polysaccharide deacetylase family protein (PEP-CTERM system associated)
MKNAISIDLEDWFCADSLGCLIKREDWDKYELRVFESTKRVLDLLRRHKTNATFFVLGWIADKLPDLIREIEKNGHEIAVHGYYHLSLARITQNEFEEDLVRAIVSLKKIGIKQDISGYRAPSFALVKNTMWCLNILEKHNFKYDSSVFPISLNPLRSAPEDLLRPYKITEQLYEFPLSCIKFLGGNIPFGGGVFFRFFPYAYTRYCINKCNSMGRPVVFYIHPWELDPGHPRLKLPWPAYMRHYYNLEKTEGRLNDLLSDFQFTTIREALGLC